MSLGKGYKFQNKAVVYISFKKHFCPHCNAHISVKEMNKHEGVYIEETSETVEQDKKANVRGKIIFFAIGFVVLIIIYLIKNLL